MEPRMPSWTSDTWTWTEKVEGECLLLCILSNRMLFLLLDLYCDGKLEKENDWQSVFSILLSVWQIVVKITIGNEAIGALRHLWFEWLVEESKYSVEIDGQVFFVNILQCQFTNVVLKVKSPWAKSLIQSYFTGTWLIFLIVKFGLPWSIE